MNPAQPALAKLFACYLKRETSAHQKGLGFAEPEGEVVPFEAVPVQPVEPRLAWEEARAVLAYLAAGEPLPALSAPPEWPACCWPLRYCSRPADRENWRGAFWPRAWRESRWRSINGIWTSVFQPPCATTW